MVPTFGRDTIRRFHNNASDMKKLARRDFEDLLQVRCPYSVYSSQIESEVQNIIPVVDGLLPEPFNSRILQMLFRLAEWQALAKLRMHTEETLAGLETSTTVMAREVRYFRTWSKESFRTVELPGETARRARRVQRKKAQADPNSTATQEPPPPTAPKGRFLNLLTYKFHALGDYVRTIRLFGTTDSYSTQIVSVHHCVLTLLIFSSGGTCASHR